MRRTILAILLVLWTAPAFAANHYIRAGATGAGNGSSWTDAWTTFGAATWTRGDTYYLSGGTYTETVVILTAPSGSLWITVKKANASDNSSDAGWDAAYATNQAVIAGSLLLPTYFDLDGVTGSGESGHGIKVYSATTPPYTGVVRLDEDNAGPRHLHHVEIKGPGYVWDARVDGIYFNSAIAKNLHISECWIHDVSVMGVTVSAAIGTSWTDYGMLFENNVVSETGGITTTDHGQGIQLGYIDAYTIIRNNVFRNITGTGHVVYLGIYSHTYARMYNNVFYTTAPTTYTDYPGVIATMPTCAADYFYIYNNTFYGLNGVAAVGNISFGNETTPPTVADVRNNLWVGNSLGGWSVLEGVASTLANNGFYNNAGTGAPAATETADPLTNAAAADFTLKGTANATTGGADLSAVFTTDKNGNARTAPWSIGAYEYGAGAPTAPTNVRIR